MPVKLRRIDNKMYSRIETYTFMGCLGCDFRICHGKCAINNISNGTMCYENGQNYKYQRATHFKY